MKSLDRDDGTAELQQEAALSQSHLEIELKPLRFLQQQHKEMNECDVMNN